MPREFFKSMWHKKNARRLAVVILAGFVGMGMVFTGYFYVAGQNPDSGVHRWMVKKVDWMIPLANKMLRLTDIVYIPWMFGPSDLPHYEIWIEDQDMRLLQKNLVNIIEEGVLDNENKMSVDMVMRFNDEILPGKIRLRGDSFMHWVNDKNSWRIKLKKGATLDGMRTFNLIIPEDRGYLAEEYSNYLARDMGLDVPQSGFVTVDINGKSQGVYFMIEQFGAEMLEKEELVSESNFYGENDDQELAGGGINLFNNLSLWKKYTEDPNEGMKSYADLRLLLDLLDIEDNDIFTQRAERILDIENLLRWQAHSVLMSSTHQEFSHNIRLFFDRTRGKFKIMPWDVGQASPDLPIDIHYSPLVTRLLDVPEYRQRRDEILWERVSNPEYLAKDLAYWDDCYKRVRSPFYRDRQKYVFNLGFDLWTKTRRRWIIERYEKVKEYLEHAHGSLVAEVGSPVSAITVKGWGSAAVRVDKITVKAMTESRAPAALYWDKNKNQTWDNADPYVGSLEWDESAQNFKGNPDTVLVVTRRLLEDRGNAQTPFILKSQREKIFVVSEWLTPKTLVDLEVDLSNAVTGENIKDENKDMKLVNKETFSALEQSFETAEQILARHPFLTKEGPDTLAFPQGVVDVNQTLIIPGGVTVLIKPGTTVRMGPNVTFLSYGKVFMRGTAEQPITVTARTDEPWGVWALLDHGADKSEIRYTAFEHGSEAYLNGVYFSGMLATHFADITVDHSRFALAHGDDGANIKNAVAHITSSRFERNNFDGLDLDFLIGGMVSGNVFSENGNDGIDLGGGTVTVYGNRVKNSKDKCLSIGEKATPVIYNNVFTGCDTGVAIKDSAEPLLLNNTITGNHIGIASYQKKPIFGGGRGRVSDAFIWDNEVAIELDDKSTISIQNSSIEGGYEGEGNVAIRP